MTEESAFITEGSVSAAAVAFLQAAVLRMIPFAVPAFALIFLDLVYGCKAANFRKERVRFSTALRRTLSKTFCYICWLILASTLALSFEKEWLEWGVLGLVYLNELSSIVGNYYESKGLKVNWPNFLKAVIGIFGQKTNTDTSGIDPGSFVEPIEKKGRKAKKQEDKADKS